MNEKNKEMTTPAETLRNTTDATDANANATPTNNNPEQAARTEAKQEAPRKLTFLEACSRIYATSDKEKYPSYDETLQNWREDTTFFADFFVANAYGSSAIRETYSRSFRNWKQNAKYLTELVMALNHHLWGTYAAGRMDLAEIYDKLWQEAHNYALENLKGEDATYYFRITD